jgi:hypothetical protein
MTAHQKSRLCDPPLASVFDAKMMWRCWPFDPTRVELESSADHDNDLWTISGLVADVSQCFCASYKEAAAETALISNYPVPAAILTDHED